MDDVQIMWEYVGGTCISAKVHSIRLVASVLSSVNQSFEMCLDTREQDFHNIAVVQKPHIYNKTTFQKLKQPDFYIDDCISKHSTMGF